MKALTRSALLATLLLLPLFGASSARAADAQVEADVIPFVFASPSYHEFGRVKAPSQATTYINFRNTTGENIPFFNTYCSGDMSVYSCSTLCLQLPPYGSCDVIVRFRPRSGDDLRKTVMVHGHGSGASASATVSGTDAR